MALTDEEEKGLRALLGKGEGGLEDRVNSVIGGRLTRFAEKELPDKLDKLGEKLVDKLKPAGDDASKGKGKGKGKSGEDDGDDVDARIEKAIAGERDVWKKRLDGIESEKKASDAKGKRDEERNELQRVLVEQGVPPGRVRAAVALLHTEDSRVKRDADGKIVFTVKKGSGANAYDDELSLADGVKQWLGSDDGKMFVPPKGARGSGSTPTQPSNRSGQPSGNGQPGKVDPVARRRQLSSTLAAALDADFGDAGDDDSE